MSTQQSTGSDNKYLPDIYYYFINIIWNILWFGFGIPGLVYLLGPHETYDLQYFCLFFMILSMWMGIVLSHVLIRRLDQKYRNRLLLDSRTGNFIILPLLFSGMTLIKCRWLRMFVYYLRPGKMRHLDKLRQEIIPEFDYRRDVKFIDKFFCWGQFISLGLGVILGFFAKWH